MPEQLPNIEPVAIALQTGRDETPRVDSRELAQRMGVKHKNTIELLDKHKADFLELGVLPFQTEKPSGPNGGRPERFALLNEDQAYLLLTYSRNTAKVRGLKVKLVQAFSAARKAAELGEIPIGAVLADMTTGEVIAVAHNMRETWHDATAHAEVIVIREACERLGRWRLSGCALYVTVEPCPMCSGAIVNGRVDRVVYGCPDVKAGGAESIFNIITNNFINFN